MHDMHNGSSYRPAIGCVGTSLCLLLSQTHVNYRPGRPPIVEACGLRHKQLRVAL